MVAELRSSSASLVGGGGLDGGSCEGRYGVGAGPGRRANGVGEDMRGGLEVMGRLANARGVDEAGSDERWLRPCEKSGEDDGGMPIVSRRGGVAGRAKTGAWCVLLESVPNVPAPRGEGFFFAPPASVSAGRLVPRDREAGGRFSLTAAPGRTLAAAAAAGELVGPSPAMTTA